MRHCSDIDRCEYLAMKIHLPYTDQPDQQIELITKKLPTNTFSYLVLNY